MFGKLFSKSLSSASSAFSANASGAVAMTSPKTGARISEQLSKDVFQSQGRAKLAVGDLAKDFRKSLVIPFSDWKEAFPADAEAGSELLAKTLKKFIGPIEKMNETEVEQFMRLTLGQSHLQGLKDGAAKNSDLKAFVDLIESKTGKEIEQILAR